MRQELGVETDLIPRIASAFGAGIGRRGDVCGAVVGSSIAIGLFHGREEPSDPRDKPYGLAQELCRRFEEEMGDIHCRRLTGIDLSTPEGIKAYYQSDVPVRVCLRATGVAFEALRGLLELASKESTAD